ncbi:SIS domain-containing protein [Microbacterium suaedae]|uniref:SIS domain-containing protein n=1 Tax=Microbacterium suaedae TaxID=2067813 RepID=UPI000DA1EA2F|nr:SIS domain-containing protein [Microbacterium suaedae]
MTDTFVEEEIATQPEMWRRAAALLPEVSGDLPHSGERIAVVGCGTSWFMAQSYAAAREAAGHGETDAFPGSEFPHGRRYDRIVAISRSGTTTEVIDLFRSASGVPTLLITGVPNSPATQEADATIALPFADERSVVQTRFATTTLALLRAHLGDDIDTLAQQAERALAVDVSEMLDAEQVTFLGRGPAVGLAAEAALKMREAARFWAESYPAMDYRHGPLAIAQTGRLVWSLGDLPPGLADDIAATGAELVRHAELDPLPALIVAQRFAVAQAKQRGLDPDRPRSLARSVILDEV